MTILTATSVAQTSTERWKASLYAALAAAVVSLLMVLLRGVPVLGALLGIVIGAAPIVGYDFARGALGENWRPVIGGLIGAVAFVIGIALPGVFTDDFGFVVAGVPISILTVIIWPIVVGAMSPNQSILKLLLASIIGLILAWIVAFLAAGQDPTSWPGIAAILFWAVWGGTVGAALSAWSK
ncbi:MAG: hypothetical protein OXC27_01515 [Caldilineaceae bacterium]|nr:hypothetical protein [Caldilineaceae bacterium]